jgi:hypothetical protein
MRTVKKEREGSTGGGGKDRQQKKGEKGTGGWV